MMNKLGYLTKVSLERKMKTKWFIAANVLLAIFTIGIMNIDNVINFFGGDFDKKQMVYVLDKSEKSYNIFKPQVKEIEKMIFDKNTIEVKVIKDTTEKTIKKDKKAIVIEIENDEANVIKAKIVSDGFVEQIHYQVLFGALTNTKNAIALNESDISPEEIAKLSSPISIERQILDDTKKTEEELGNAIMSTVFPFFILPFFMLTIFLVQMIGAEVNDEKTTRAMEMIISNVSPATHFFSKVLAGNIFVLSQGLLLFTFGGIGLLTRKILGGSNGIPSSISSEVGSTIKLMLESDFGQNLIYIIPLTLILMLLTFVAYSLLAGILASMTTNIEDFQQLQTPIIVISLLGYYLAMMASLFKGAVFIKVLAFVPLISAILSPSLLVLGQIGIIEVLISILISILFNYLLIKYGLKIYKVGILNYSTTGLWKKMFKALKN